MMEVCYNNHSEIAYSAKHCPFCEVIRTNNVYVKETLDFGILFPKVSDNSEVELLGCSDSD